MWLEESGGELALGPVPGRHLLLAAARVHRCLSLYPQAIVPFRARFRHLPTEGLFSLQHFLIGEEILIRGGFAVREEGTIYLTTAGGCQEEELLARYLESSPPPWLGMATRDGIVDTGLIPWEDLEALVEVLGNPDRRDALLLALGKKFKEEVLGALGLAAEEVVVEACRGVLRSLGRADLAMEVLHASRISDQLGYDVRTPVASGGVLRIEVKNDMTMGDGRRFFLSRNEWQIAKSDTTWRLVLCVTEGEGAPQIFGWLPGAVLADLMPKDSAVATWQSAEVRLDGSVFSRGLPDLMGD